MATKLRVDISFPLEVANLFSLSEHTERLKRVESMLKDWGYDGITVDMVQVRNKLTRAEEIARKKANEAAAKSGLPRPKT